MVPPATCLAIEDPADYSLSWTSVNVKAGDTIRLRYRPDAQARGRASRIIDLSEASDDSSPHGPTDGHIAGAVGRQPPVFPLRTLVASLARGQLRDCTKIVYLSSSGRTLLHCMTTPSGSCSQLRYTRSLGSLMSVILLLRGTSRMARARILYLMLRPLLTHLALTSLGGCPRLFLCSSEHLLFILCGLRGVRVCIPGSRGLPSCCLLLEVDMTLSCPSSSQTAAFLLFLRCHVSFWSACCPPQRCQNSLWCLCSTDRAT